MALGERQSDNKRHKITGDELAAFAYNYAQQQMEREA